MNGGPPVSLVVRCTPAGLFIIAAFLLQRADTALRNVQLQAAELGAAVQPVPTETAFPQPSPIVWSGTIARIFVSGAALEIRSADAPGGRFHAYMPDGTTSPFTDGSVRVTGAWRGWTCDYSQACVPEVDITDIVRTR